MEANLHFTFGPESPILVEMDKKESSMTTDANIGTADLDAFGKRIRCRLKPGIGQRPGRPSDPSWKIQRKLSMKVDTFAALERIANAVSTDERRVSPMQIAALLIEDATQGIAQQLKSN